MTGCGKSYDADIRHQAGTVTVYKFTCGMVGGWLCPACAEALRAERDLAQSREWTAIDRAEQTEAQLSSVTAERDTEITRRAKAEEDCHNLHAKWRESEARAERLAVLVRSVEWHGDLVQWDGTRDGECPWCYKTQEDGHAPDCPRQLALGE